MTSRSQHIAHSFVLPLCTVFFERASGQALKSPNFPSALKRLISLSLITTIVNCPTFSRGQDIEFRQWLLDELGHCLEAIEPAPRLSCYDKLVPLIARKTTTDIVTPDDKCELKAFTMSKRGSHGYITGEMSCSDGRLDYRLYDAETEKFLESGFTYFQGFAVQFYMDISKIPKTLTIKYSVRSQ